MQRYTSTTGSLAGHARRHALHHSRRAVVVARRLRLRDALPAGGFRGGYDDYRAGAGGAIMVTFQGNGYTSEGAVVKMWHRRAAEVCGGADRYVVLDAERSSSVTEGASTSTTNVMVSGNHATATTTTSPGMRWERHRLEGLIRCVDSK